MSARERMQDEQGQVFPVLAVLLVSLLVLAFYLFSAGGGTASGGLGGAADAVETTYEIRLVPYPGGE